MAFVSASPKPLGTLGPVQGPVGFSNRIVLGGMLTRAALRSSRRYASDDVQDMMLHYTLRGGSGIAKREHYKEPRRFNQSDVQSGVLSTLHILLCPTALLSDGAAHTCSGSNPHAGPIEREAASIPPRRLPEILLELGIAPLGAPGPPVHERHALVAPARLVVVLAPGDTGAAAQRVS